MYKIKGEVGIMPASPYFFKAVWIGFIPICAAYFFYSISDTISLVSLKFLINGI